ncbi:MAG: hypothetical protein LBR37_02680 [Erysipelotrichaceae bacterium]|jgi:Tfp pilus assembly protein PilN|nr:hypothetical protein [Erysipelotrichaceae bacterium]
MKKIKLTVTELVMYLVASLITIAGLTLIIIGLVAENYPALPSDNPLLESEKSLEAFLGLGLNYRNLGLIVLMVGAFIAFVTLLVRARSIDKVQEKTQRRKQRLQNFAADEAHAEKPLEE